MISRIRILGTRRLLKIVGVYFAAGGWSGLAFYYLTRVKALEAVFFTPSEKFLIATYNYWGLLGVSLLAAIATGWIITRMAGWQNRVRVLWFRHVLASILVATSVPFQAWLFNTRQQVNADFGAWNTNDIYVVAGAWAIAIFVFSVGLLTKARWAPRLSMSLFVIAVLAVWPTGVFALFLTLAAYAVTGRLEIKFALTVVLAVIAGLLEGALVSRTLGLTSIWPLVVASVSALCGYQLYRVSPSTSEVWLTQLDTALIQGRCSGSDAIG